MTNAVFGVFLVRGKYGKEKVVVVHKRGTTALVNYLFTLLALLVKKVMAFISLCSGRAYRVYWSREKRIHEVRENNLKG
ncbi:hypothetical protein [Streptococcus orisratti]|uniref:hypothetical protein n=1 Tax=Streptococcus orisratti TaxID=114652 RepID=UPI003CFBC65D